MMKVVPGAVTNVLDKLHISEPILLGKGGEGYVFLYRHGDIIKIFTKQNINESYLQNLAKFQKKIAGKNLPFSIPEIKDIGTIDNTHYSIEKRLTGMNMDQKFPSLSTKEKYRLLKNYYEAIKALNAIELPEFPYGNIIETETAITDPTWSGFLIKKIRQRIGKAGKKLFIDVPDLEARIQQFEKIIQKELVINNKHFVHADYFPNQVLVDEKNSISAILDISYHAVSGDSRLDAASVVFFYGIKNYLPEHVDYLVKLETIDYGDDIVKYNKIYKIYYCFYFSNIYSYIPSFYDIVIKNLNDKNTWRNLN